MARRAGGGGLTQNGQSHANGEPPPSTLAAKIVENRSKTVQQNQPEGKELFSKLLQEYLADPTIEESSLETNAKLIKVVAEAGLDTLLRDDPFSRDDRIQQAKDSIAVIRLTIERVPTVLFYSEASSSNSLSLPLFLGLLPKVISLFGRPHLDAIQSDLTALLETCMSVGRKSTRSWQASEAIDSILRLCVDGNSLLFSRS